MGIKKKFRTVLQMQTETQKYKSIYSITQLFVNYNKKTEVKECVSSPFSQIVETKDRKKKIPAPIRLLLFEDQTDRTDKASQKQSKYFG